MNKILPSRNDYFKVTRHCSNGMASNNFMANVDGISFAMR